MAMRAPQQEVAHNKTLDETGIVVGVTRQIHKIDGTGHRIGPRLLSVTVMVPCERKRDWALKEWAGTDDMEVYV